MEHPDPDPSKAGSASVKDAAGDTTWKCREFVPEGPFDDGEIMWHFEMQLVETGEEFLVSISGPKGASGANFARALVGTAGIIAESIGVALPGVTLNAGRPN